MSKKEIEIVEQNSLTSNHKEERESIERKLFCQWVIDLIELNELLSKKYNRWYQQLFYIKLVGLFEYVSYTKAEYEYFIHAQKCINEMYNNLTDKEFAFIVYQRNTCSHIKLDGYELYDSNGQLNIKSRAFTKNCNEHLRKEQVNKSKILDDIRKIYSSVTTIHDLDITLRNKLFSSIKDLEKGLNREIDICGLKKYIQIM